MDPRMRNPYLQHKGALLFYQTDNIVVAITHLSADDEVILIIFPYTLTSNVPAKHKVTLCARQGGPSAHGVLVGRVSEAIRADKHIGRSNVCHQTKGSHTKMKHYF